MLGMMTLSVSVRLLSSPSDTLTILVGGNIKGAVNSPSESFTQNVTELVRRYEEGKFGGAIGNGCFAYCCAYSAQSRVSYVYAASSGHVGMKLMAYWQTALFPSSGKYECADAHDNTLIIAVPLAQRPQSCPCKSSRYITSQDWILTPLRPDLFRDPETAQPRVKAGSLGLTGRIHGFPAIIQSQLRIIFWLVYADSSYLQDDPALVEKFNKMYHD